MEAKRVQNRKKNNEYSVLVCFFAMLVAGLLLSSSGAVQAQPVPGVCGPQNGPEITCAGEVVDQSAHFVEYDSGRVLGPFFLEKDENTGEISVPGDPWPTGTLLAVEGKDARVLNQGKLHTTGVMPIGAFILGLDNRLVNEAGSEIISVSEVRDDDSRIRPAFGVWMINAWPGPNGRSELVNNGLIEANGGAGLELSVPLYGENNTWYTSGVFLVGNSVQVQNAGIIRAQQGKNGELSREGDDDLVVGISSFWYPAARDLPAASDSGPAPNSISNEGQIEAINAYKAVGVLLWSDPEAELPGDESYQQYLFNKEGGTIDAAGKAEAVGVSVRGGYASVDNAGTITATSTGTSNSIAVGLSAEGAGVQIVNAEKGNIAANATNAVGVWLTGTDVTLHNSGTVSASGENATALRVDPDEGYSVALLDTEANAEPQVVNAGVLNADGSSAVGVELKVDGLRFENAADGKITSEGDSAIGVWVQGNGVTVVNLGTVEAIRRDPDAVAAQEDPSPGLPRVAAVALDGDTGTVENEGTIRGVGDEAIGIDMVGASGFVHNKASGAVEAAGARAIAINMQGASGNVTNEGVVKATGTDAIGINVQGYSGSVTNAGEITADGAGAIGVLLAGLESTLVNNEGGVITATGKDSVGVALGWSSDSAKKPLENSGEISGEGVGVYVLADGEPVHDSVIENKGKISGGTGVQIAFTSSGSSAVVKLVNDEGGVIAGGTGPAILSSDITEDGTGKGAVDLESRGDIDGDVYLASGGNDNVRILGGQVGGDINLGGGKDELTVATGAYIDGTVDGGGAGEENRLELQGGGTGQLVGVQNFREIVVHSADGWEFGQLSLDEKIEHQVNVTGPLTVGVLYLGPESVLTVRDAQLVIDNVSIYDEYDFEGFLSGTGTIDGNVRLEGGYLSPGAGEGEIGTITIKGNYVQGSEGTFFVDVRPKEEGQEFGPSDQLYVPEGEGTVVFEEGSTILLRAQAGLGGYDPITTYRIVDGELPEEMEDVLPSLNVVTNSPFLVGSLQLGSLVAVLEKDFGWVANTPNQRSVARVLSNAPGGVFGAMEDALLFGLASQGAARDALDQLSGEIYTAYLGVSESTLSHFNRIIVRGMDLPVPMEEEHRKIWADAYGHFSTVQSTADTARVELEQTGVVFGIAREVSEHTRIGFLGGVNRTRVDMPARRSKSDGDGFQVGAYGRYRGETASLTGILAFSEGRHDVERHIRFGAYQANPEGRVNERALGATVEGRLHYRVSGFEVEPMLNVTWMDLAQSSVREKSGNEANLRIAKTGADLLRASAGVRIGTQPARTGVWPEFILAWVRDFEDIPSEVEARFEARPDSPFRVEGTQVGRSALVAGLSIEGIRESGTTWQLGYRGEFRDKRSVHIGTLSFHFPF